MMYRCVRVLALVLVSVIHTKAQVTEPAAKARNFLQLLNTGKFDSAYQMESAEMKRQIDARQLEVIWTNFTDTYDSLSSIEETTLTDKDSLIVTETIIRFVKKGFKYRLTLNRKGEVDGLFFQYLNLPYSPPTYINTLNFYELKLPVPTPGIHAEGVLALPQKIKNPPLIIIVGGSGPTDKDGSVGPNKMYKDLAWALAARGFAVYRFDKRTVNPENSKVSLETMHDEYVTDLQNIINHFQQDKRINPKRIYVMGHSQGGMMLPYFAKTCNGIYGYIGLAAPFHTITDLLPAQLTYLSTLNKEDSAALNALTILKLKAIYQRQHLHSNSINKDSLFPGLTIPFMRHMDVNRPANLIRFMKNKPCLLLQGARDYQVPVEELEAWKAALPKAKNLCTYTFEKLNHQFMEGVGVPGPKEYNTPNNVPEYVIDELVNWLKTQAD